jgi:AcrR family transcriptional regulator
MSLWTSSTRLFGRVVNIVDEHCLHTVLAKLSSRREVLVEMITQPTVPDAGADGTDPSAAGARRADGPDSRSLILQSALEIIDRDGVDGLSMRRLSDEVGRDPMVLYRHVPNKAAMLDGVVEIVLGQIHVDTADADWATRLRTVAHHSAGWSWSRAFVRLGCDESAPGQDAPNRGNRWHLGHRTVAAKVVGDGGRAGVVAGFVQGLRSRTILSSASALTAHGWCWGGRLAC